MADALETAMGLIAGAGDSRSCSMEAIAFAREGDFQKAREALENASGAMVGAHDVQTGLIRKEMSGEASEVSLLMVHAQDHMTMALLMRDLAEEIIEIYRKLAKDAD